MSFNPNFDDDDELPEFLKEFIKKFSGQFGSLNPEDMTDFFKKMNEIDPDELENVLKNMLGEEFFDKLSSFGENFFNQFGGEFDASKFQSGEFPDLSKLNIDFSQFSPNKQKPKVPIETKIDEEAYNELVETENGYEIVVDLPGISDPRQVNWNVEDGTLLLSATGEDVKYTSKVKLPDAVAVQNHLTKLNNSIFIIPLRRL